MCPVFGVHKPQREARTLPLALHTTLLGYKVSHGMGSSQFRLNWPA